MPWKTNSELPDRVKSALPAAAQTRWREVANGVLAKGGSDSSAAAQAWYVVKQGWKKDKTGAWIRKSAREIELTKRAVYQSLYVCRPVVNADDIIKWAKGQGFKTTLPADDLHVTICYSKNPVDWMKAGNGWGMGQDEKGNVTILPGGPRMVQPLGDGGAVVLMFASSDLQWRHDAIRRDTGASWDFEGYQPHITITWQAGDVDLSKVEPYDGKIVLGPEKFEPVKDNFKDEIVEKAAYNGMLRKFDPNQPRANNGEWTDGGGGGKGGVAHIATHIVGRVAGNLASEQVRGDWFMGAAAGAARSSHEVERAAQINDALHASPSGFNNVSFLVAKEVVHQLAMLGVEVAIGGAIGKAARLMLPFIGGPAKNVATAAASVVLGRAALAVGSKTPILVQSLRKAITGSLERSGIAKAEVSTKTLTDFQLTRILAILDEMDPSDLASQHAQALLQMKDPSMYQHLLNDLEDAGFTDYDQTVEDHSFDARVVKVDKSLGLVFGWAIVCKKNGQDYFDKNIDLNSGERVPEHIPEQAMLEASADFMENSRVHKEMHDGDARGSAVFAFPMTTEIAKALNIDTHGTTGLLVAMKPDKAMLAKYESGELTGFSVGGSRVKSRELKVA